MLKTGQPIGYLPMAFSRQKTSGGGHLFSINSINLSNSPEKAAGFLKIDQSGKNINVFGTGLTSSNSTFKFCDVIATGPKNQKLTVEMKNPRGWVKEFEGEITDLSDYDKNSKKFFGYSEDGHWLMIELHAMEKNRSHGLFITWETENPYNIFISDKNPFGLIFNLDKDHEDLLVTKKSHGDKIAVLTKNMNLPFEKWNEGQRFRIADWSASPSWYITQTIQEGPLKNNGSYSGFTRTYQVAVRIQGQDEKTQGH